MTKKTRARGPDTRYLVQGTAAMVKRIKYCLGCRFLPVVVEQVIRFVQRGTTVDEQEEWRTSVPDMRSPVRVSSGHMADPVARNARGGRRRGQNVGGHGSGEGGRRRKAGVQNTGGTERAGRGHGSRAALA